MPFDQIIIQVAGCGFKGCSGSLVRAPSFSDDDGGPDLLPPPLPPPLLPPLIPAAGFSSSVSLPPGVFGGAGGGSLPGGNSATSSGVFSPQAAKPPNRLRMSFRRGPSPCDTFDNEEDSSSDEEERSALGASSQSSSAPGW